MQSSFPRHIGEGLVLRDQGLMGQTWVSSFISSRIVHVVNGNQTEIADVIASSLTAQQGHGMSKWAEHTKPPKTPKILSLRWR